MAMNRRAAVASKLLKQAGVTGDFMRVVESLPPETLVQYDKLLKHEEPSVGPGMDSGIVVSYKSGEVVQDRPMLGNVTPRQEGVSRDAPRGRSVLDLGYAYSTPEATFSVQATPFGRRVVTDPKTGDTEMDRSVMARYTSRF